MQTSGQDRCNHVVKWSAISHVVSDVTVATSISRDKRHWSYVPYVLGLLRVQQLAPSRDSPWKERGNVDAILGRANSRDQQGRL